jgi:hypothetical protein
MSSDQTPDTTQPEPPTELVERMARVFVSEGPEVPWEQLTDRDQRIVQIGVRAILAALPSDAVRLAPEPSRYICQEGQHVAGQVPCPHCEPETAVHLTPVDQPGDEHEPSFHGMPGDPTKGQLLEENAHQAAELSALQAEIERLKAELERLARWEETGSLTIQRLNAELAELSARFGLSEDRGDNRCPSCEHRISMHGDEGCVQEIDHGPGDEPCCCPCAVEVDGTAQARDQAGTGDTAQPGGDVIEQRAAEVVQEAIWPALRDQVDESWTYSEVRNLLTTKAVDALAANLLLATHPEGPTARRDPLTRELNSKIVHAYTSKTHKPGIPSTLIRALIEEGVFARPEPEPARPDTPTEPGGVLEDGGDGPTDVGDTDSQGAGQC